ncbi:TonB-dependent receptor [Sphingomonas sp. Root710]|uniref:TonB-dependent receptor plug domain-containing protein n=1 Tax=Sphingomonas sp. Root710 TaxID=1736594 RepID=UPI0006F86A2E|nr:TonB-dependent receptor [Sphingomonas sp. Root710]KRB79307.1 TonB-dependent receptor [Sphingomonas sp. Root710]
MRTFTKTLIPALALLPAILSTPAWADEAAADGETIVVTAGRSEQKLSEVGKSISVIGIETLEQRQTASVADILRTMPGVTIQRNGGLGTITSVFIRGAQSEQTVALIDGVKLNDPSSPGGGFSFADLLTDNLERIEVLRGPQSVLWGSQAIGGVVNIITRAPTDSLELRATGEYGSFETGRLSGAVTGRVGPTAISAGAGYLTTDGISVAEGGTEKDGYHLFGIYIKTNTELSDWASLDMRGFYTRSKVDLDGFSSSPPFAFGDTGEYQRQNQIVGYGGLNAEMFDGRFKNRIAASFTRIDRDTYDPAAAIVKNFDARGSNLRFEYQGIADLGIARATFGAEHQQEKLRTLDAYFLPAGTPAFLSKEKANLDSVYLDAHAEPIEGLNVGAGVRYDDHNQFGDATTLSADLAYTPNAGSTVIRASYGEGFKAPSLYQLYGSFGFDGLRPEKAKGWDAGITQKLIGDAVEVRATWFQRKTVNQIDFDLGTFTYANIARARARGAEVELRITPTSDLLFTANYTYSKAINREPTDPNFGNDLARRPRNVVNVTGDYRWAFGLSTGATITHVSKSFDNAGNTSLLGDYVLVDLRAAFPVTGAIELYGRIENLFDERYQTAAGYGQPGRAAYAGIRLRY